MNKLGQVKKRDMEWGGVLDSGLGICSTRSRGAYQGVKFYSFLDWLSHSLLGPIQPSLKGPDQCQPQHNWGSLRTKLGDPLGEADLVVKDSWAEAGEQSGGRKNWT